MNLNSIMIGSENPQDLIDYYTKLFGKPIWEGDGFGSWEIGSGSVSVGPHDKVEGKSTHPGRVIWNIETANVKDEFERLTNAGATVVKEPYEPEGALGMWVATFADPDDNYFQLMSPMTSEEK